MRALFLVALFALGCANASTPTSGDLFWIGADDTETMEIPSVIHTVELKWIEGTQLDTETGSWRTYDGCNWTTCYNGGGCTMTVMYCAPPPVTCQQEDGTWDWCR